MSNERSSKILKLVLDKPNSNSEVLTAGQNFENGKFYCIILLLLFNLLVYMCNKNIIIICYSVL